MFGSSGLGAIAAPRRDELKHLAFLNAVTRGPDVFHVGVKMANTIITFRVIGMWRRPKNRTEHGEGGSFRVDCVNVLDGTMPEMYGTALKRLRDTIWRGLEPQVAPAELIPFGVDRMDME